MEELEAKAERGFKTLLAKVGKERSDLKNRAKETGERFSPFSEDLIYMGEIGVERILTILFSPDGAHGQGKLFLDGLLELISEAELPSPDENLAIVDKERWFWGKKSSRRADMVIEASEFILAIEIKLDAEDRAGQFADYLIWLNRVSRGRKFYAVYLAPSGRLPTEESLPREIADNFREHWSALSWERLLEELKNKAVETPDRVRIFVEDFCGGVYETLQKQGQSPMNMEIARLIANECGADELAAAAAIKSSYDLAAIIIINQWSERLKSELLERGVKVEIEREELSAPPRGEWVILKVTYPLKKLIVGVCVAPYYNWTLDWGLWAKGWEFNSMDECKAHPYINAAIEKFDATDLSYNYIVRDSAGDFRYDDPRILALLRDPSRVFLADKLFELCQEVEAMPPQSAEDLLSDD
ncbi:MAG: PD-(D/E)XK nuclease family protein [Desulfovibrio sp.]|nr:PD-(D/E)XK nuclease family protein [Desulfovibrio sp.]